LVAAFCLGGALLTLAAISSEPRLAAASNTTRSDLDQDGLSDTQELVLRTRPDLPDTDRDGFSDLEECARGSNPLDAAALPPDAPFSVRTCANLQNGVVTLVSTIFRGQDAPEQLELRVGVVHRGQVFTGTLAGLPGSRGFRRSGSDPADRLTLIEIPVPESIVHRLGSLNFFSVVRCTLPGGPPPVVSVLSLMDLGGITTTVEQHSFDAQTNQPPGVVYRPLAGDDSIPATWNGGEICFQRPAAVGVNGASIIHEIEAADCLPMDTYCSPTDCSAGVGKAIQLPDPAALAGG
jgi:hypothetical protein